MGSRKLARVPGIESEWCSLLQQNNIVSCRDVLMMNIVELMNILRSYSTAHRLLKLVGNSVAPTPCRVLALQQRNDQKFLPTSVRCFDELLHGGLHIGSITEIAGPPGCGKTQFSMTVSASTALQCCDGGEGSVVYLDTENAFSASRLQEIIHHKLQGCRIDENIGGDGDNKTDEHADATRRVIVYLERSFESLDQRLKDLENVIIRKKVRLIVLDSIASLARKEFGHHSLLNERNKIMVKQAMLLKYYAQTFQIAVMVTNQIAKAVHSTNQKTVVPSEFEGTWDAIPALGNTWAHAVNTRMVVKFTDGGVREMCLEKSPIAPPLKTRYCIDSQGVVGVT